MSIIVHSNKCRKVAARGVRMFCQHVIIFVKGKSHLEQFAYEMRVKQHAPFKCLHWQIKFPPTFRAQTFRLTFNGNRQGNAFKFLIAISMLHVTLLISFLILTKTTRFTLFTLDTNGNSNLCTSSVNEGKAYVFFVGSHACLIKWEDVTVSDEEAAQND